VQAALKLVLEPVFEAHFASCSYGFRPNRRAQDAIAEIHHFTTKSYQWVLEADIEACFDNIDHVAFDGASAAADRRQACPGAGEVVPQGQGADHLWHTKGRRCPLPVGGYGLAASPSWVSNSSWSL